MRAAPSRDTEGRPLITNRWRADLVTVSLMFIFLTGALTLTLLPVVIDGLQSRFGFSNSSIGLLTSVFLGFYGVAGLLAGFFAPRWGGWLLGLSCGCFVVGSLVFALSSSFAGFLVGRAIQGIGGGMVIATSSVVMANSLPRERLGRAWGILGCGWGLGSMLALLIMPSIERAGGFRAVFLTTAGLALVVGAAALAQKAVRTLPQHPEGATSLRGLTRSMGSAAGNYRVLLNGFANTAALAVMVGMLTWGPRFLEDVHGAGKSTSLYLLAAFGAVQLVANPLGAAASAKWGKYAVISVCLALMVVVTALEGFVPGVVLAFGLVLFAGFVSMFYFPPMMAYLPEIVRKPEQLGSATGINAVMGFTGSMVAPWIFGRMLDVGDRSALSYASGFLTLAAFAFAAFIAWLFFRPRGVGRSPDRTGDRT